MITKESTLTEICFEVSTALELCGMPAVLTGGSAAAVYAPDVYASMDADYILDADNRIEDVAKALADLGFERYGKSRLFTHTESRYTVDFPKGPLAVGNDYLHDIHVMRQGDLRLRILKRSDCIRDRLAHYYHWNDYTALKAALGVAENNTDAAELEHLKTWTLREGPAFLEKFEEFKKRLAMAESARKL